MTTPSYDAGLKPGTKRAVIYDYLAGRVEATFNEIRLAVRDNKVFSPEQSKSNKEISDTLRFMIDARLIKKECSDPPVFFVSAPSAIGQVIESIDGGNFEKTQHTIPTFQEIMSEPYPIEEKDNLAECVPVINENQEPIMTPEIEKLLGEMTAAEVESHTSGIVEVPFYKATDGSIFHDLEQAKEWQAILNEHAIFESFLENEADEIRINGPAVVDLLLHWEKMRNKYVGGV